MCGAPHPPQVPNQGQIGVARSGEGSSVSTSSARLPSNLTSVRSPGRAPGTMAPLAASPCPCASSAAMETSSSGSVMTRRDQEFPCSSPAEDWRRHKPKHGPALRFNRRAHAVTCALERRFARDPALDQIGAVELELGLDQTDEPRPLGGELERVRKHQPLRNEADINDDRSRLLTEYFRG